MRFSLPVTHIYNPLHYAWDAHSLYVKQFADTPKKVIFMGMNPRPWGMAQTGVPFGEIPSVRDWMNINAPISKPAKEHPKRIIEGFSCNRSEVSGRRLWGLFKERFGSANAFFKDHFVLNYCPLVFMEESGRNRTPDKLPSIESTPLYAACNEHLQDIIRVLNPTWVVGVGAFAATQAKAALATFDVKVEKILHPSPASPAANKGWGPKATQQLIELGIWS